MDLLTIAAQIEAYESCGFVVLTGGEPSLQADEELCQMLHNKGLYIAMETNGTHAITNGVDWITCSPKSAFLPHALPVITQADEVKVIYDGLHIGLPANLTRCSLRNRAARLLGNTTAVCERLVPYLLMMSSATYSRNVFISIQLL